MSMSDAFRFSRMPVAEVQYLYYIDAIFQAGFKEV